MGFWKEAIADGISKARQGIIDETMDMAVKSCISALDEAKVDDSEILILIQKHYDLKPSEARIIFDEWKRGE